MAFKSVLKISDEISDELVLPRHLTVVGNADSDARLVLQHINRQGRDLVRTGPENGWTILQRLHTFSTVASQAEYNLPDDYHRLVTNTVWDRTRLTPLNGPITPFEWQVIKSSLIASGTYSRNFRIVRSTSTIARKFTIDPTPTTGGDTLAFEYISTGWSALVDLSSVSDQIRNDTDLVLFDADLMVSGVKWRWRSSHGFDIIAALAEYNELLDRLMGADAPASDLSLIGPTYTDDERPRLSWYNIPEHNFGT